MTGLSLFRFYESLEGRCFPVYKWSLGSYSISVSLILLSFITKLFLFDPQCSLLVPSIDYVANLYFLCPNSTSSFFGLDIFLISMVEIFLALLFLIFPLLIFKLFLSCLKIWLLDDSLSFYVYISCSRLLLLFLFYLTSSIIGLNNYVIFVYSL